jgi:hypothetical protein
LLVTKGRRTYLWEPFSERYAGIYEVERNLYKNVYGDKLVFEETNRDLGLTYRYAWRTGERYGFVKTTWLKDESGDGCPVALVDGLQNLLPYAVNVQVQRLFSNLLNAYKRNELEPQTGLGIFALSSGLTDLAEPSESLRATTVWQAGLDNACYLLSSHQLAAFERGGEIIQETDVRGRSGSYLVHAAFDLSPAEEREWHIVAEVNQDHGSIVSLINSLRGDKTELRVQLDEDVAKGTKDLVSIVANADGLQLTGDRLSAAHHFSNTLFNTMRGGIFADNDDVLDDQIGAIVAEMGTDGKLVLDARGRVFHVSLAEKLLVLLLAKLANFVPGGGIWMNTQRPEWNDANNALSGKGLSVVTLCYLRRFVVFFQQLMSEYRAASLEVTQEVKAAFDAMCEVLQRHKSALQACFDDRQCRAVMDGLGQTGSDYRQGFYQNGFSGAFTDLDREALLGFMALAQQYIEHTLRENRRKDGLYHAYNVLQVGEGTATVGHLYEMLEGQVAILSSGLLSGEESLTLLRSLRQSALYRADQHSYILYPDRDLPGFLHKNRLHPDLVKKSVLLTRLIEQGDGTLTVRDENGMCHFPGSYRNAKDVKRALAGLREREEYADLVDTEYDSVLELFENVFDHASFTGRSGTFFAYEGLGSIYWHMVSKLLLAVQETLLRIRAQGESSSTIQALIDTYYDIRAGIGFNKPPDVYGAFPTDPYSHTPAGQGAKQPGMTGQVKEELLARIAELGAFVEQGVLSFDPLMLRESEFTTQKTTFHYIDVHGQGLSIELPPSSLAYTFCQVPIVYICSDDDRIDIAYSSGRQRRVAGHYLDVETSGHVFRRDGHIGRITVHLRMKSLILR